MEAFERAFGTEAEKVAQRMERNDSKEEKTNPVENGFQKLSSQVNRLEGLVESLLTVTQSLNKYREINDTNVRQLGEQLEETRTSLRVVYLDELRLLSNRASQLENKLKETIVSIEKLAKGKSLGALGLPPLESWDPPA